MALGTGRLQLRFPFQLKTTEQQRSSTENMHIPNASHHILAMGTSANRTAHAIETPKYYHSWKRLVSFNNLHYWQIHSTDTFVHIKQCMLPYTIGTKKSLEFHMELCWHSHQQIHHKAEIRSAHRGLEACGQNFLLYPIVKFSLFYNKKTSFFL